MVQAMKSSEFHFSFNRNNNYLVSDKIFEIVKSVSGRTQHLIKF